MNLLNHLNITIDRLTAHLRAAKAIEACPMSMDEVDAFIAQIIATSDSLSVEPELHAGDWTWIMDADGEWYNAQVVDPAYTVWGSNEVAGIAAYAPIPQEVDGLIVGYEMRPVLGCIAL